MFHTIEFSNVSFYYEEDQKVLDTSSFSLPLNKWVLIKGEFGSGKSTLIKLLLGLIEPYQGEIKFNQENIHELGFEKFSEYLGHIGHVLGEEGLFANQSLFDNLALPLIYHKNMALDDRTEWIDSCIKRFHLLGHKTDRPAFVTKEIKKIFLILRALILKPELVVINNLLEDLSYTNQKRVIELLEYFQKEHGLKHIIIAAEDERPIAGKEAIILELRKGRVHEI
jgi:phospholipid/cholesterol/gamma-HCH transport system ATP-binding protein